MTSALNLGQVAFLIAAGFAIAVLLVTEAAEERVLSASLHAALGAARRAAKFACRVIAPREDAISIPAR